MKRRTKCIFYQKIAITMAVVLFTTPLGVAADGMAFGVTKASAAGTTATLAPEELNVSAADSGSAANPIEISNAGQLYKLSQILSNNPVEEITSGGIKYCNASYKLTADIAINRGTANADGSFTMFDSSSPFVWEPIRNFAGKFDGNGHTVSGLYLTEDSAEALGGSWKDGSIPQPNTGSGLFGYTKDGAEISNLTISNSTIKLESKNCETAHFAFITGYADKTKLTGCKVTEDCYINAKGSVWADESGYWSVSENSFFYAYNTVAGIGGIAGMLFGNSTVTECQNAASITCQDIRLVGGIAGYAGTACITGSANTGAVSGNQAVGGIAGASAGKIENCKNSGKITAIEWTQELYNNYLSNATSYNAWSNSLLCGNIAGGICGYSAAAISRCQNTAEITGKKMLGGIAGVTETGICNSMNEGKVIATDWTFITPSSKGSSENAMAGCQAGGIVGSIGTDFSPLSPYASIQIEACSNIGEVYAANASDTQADAKSSYGGIAGWGHFAPSAPPEASDPSASAAPVVPMNIVSCFTAANGQPESNKAFSSQVGITGDTANGIYPASAANSFYLASVADENGGRTKEQFTGGAVAYELNQAAASERASGVNWYQRLKDSDTQKADVWPVSYQQAADCAVHRAALTINGKPVYLYFNSGWTLEEILKHNSSLLELTSGQYQLKDTAGKVIEKDTTFTADFSCNAEVTYTVEIVEPADAHMARKTESGQSKQSGLTGKMTDVVYTANDGYYFPDNYTVTVSDGITVTRNSSAQITISGTPTKDVKFTLVAATPKQTAAPTPTPSGSSSGPSGSGTTTTATPAPTAVPTTVPTVVPTAVPTTVPTTVPTAAPTQNPSEPTPGGTQAPAQTTAPTPSTADSPAPSEKPVATPMPNGTSFKQSGISFEVSSGNSVTLSRVPASATKKNLKVPDTVTVNGKTYKVKTIDRKAFTGNKKIKNVTIGKNVTTIGKNAFKNCSNLKKVTFNSKVKTIGAGSFANCKKINSVVLPDSITRLGNRAFKNCTGLKVAKIGKTRSDRKMGALSETTVTNTVPVYHELKLNISIGNNVFENCKNLKSVIINSAVSVIGNSAFKNCMKLSDIIVRSLILKTVAKKALVGVTNCKIAVPTQKFAPYRKLFKNKGQGKKVFVAKA